MGSGQFNSYSMRWALVLGIFNFDKCFSFLRGKFIICLLFYLQPISVFSSLIPFRSQSRIRFISISDPKVPLRFTLFSKDQRWTGTVREMSLLEMNNSL